MSKRGWEIVWFWYADKPKVNLTHSTELGVASTEKKAKADLISIFSHGGMEVRLH